MASNPQCCLTADEWSERFARLDGARRARRPAQRQHLLRPAPARRRGGAGAPLTEQVQRTASALPRFIKQIAGNALRNRPPLSWLGGIETREVDGRAWST